MQKSRVLNTRAIAEIAIFAAIAFILDFIQEKLFTFVPFFANGGSIGFAMVPVMLIALRRGVISGGICGLITSLLQMLGGMTVIGGDNWQWYDMLFQVLLDYTLTYPMVGLLAGIFSHFIKNENKNINLLMVILAAVCGGLGKFLCHFLAGCIFWQSFEIFGSSVTATVYSLIYNGLYCFPNIVICGIIIAVLYLKMPKFFYLDYEGEIE